MITVEVNLIPFGSRLYGEVLFTQARIWTTGCGGFHAYSIDAIGPGEDDRKVLAEGQVPKTKSGHRNPLHLLSAILADIDLDALGLNYVTTCWDVPRKDPVA